MTQKIENVRCFGRTGRTRPATKTRPAYINIRSEAWKFAHNRKTLLDAESLLFHICGEWLEMVDAEESAAKEQTGINELERMFRLEDPRG